MTTPASTAKQRLVASRHRIRAELMLIVHPPAKPPFFARPGSIGEKLKGVLSDIPGVAAANHAVHDWWADHPAHDAAVVSGRASAALIQPVVRRHPRSMLLLAGALGGAVVVLRPWRWLMRPRVLLRTAARVTAARPASARPGLWSALFRAAPSIARP